MPAENPAKPVAKVGRPRPTDIDRLAGLKLRQYRARLGFTLQQMADFLGLTYQQVYKYETGINRIWASRLYQITEVLGLEVDYFFSEESQAPSFALPHQRMPLKLVRNFMAIADPRQKQLVCDLARSFADSASDEENQSGRNGRDSSLSQG